MTSKVEFLAGEVAAVRALLFALIRTHPDPKVLAAEFARLRTMQEATSIPSTVPDEYLAGQSETADQIAKYLEVLGDSRSS